MDRRPKQWTDTRQRNGVGMRRTTGSNRQVEARRAVLSGRSTWFWENLVIKFPGSLDLHPPFNVNRDILARNDKEGTGYEVSFDISKDTVTALEEQGYVIAVGIHKVPRGGELAEQEPYLCLR